MDLTLIKMKVIYSIFLVVLIISCTQHTNNKKITLEYKNNNIFINYGDNKEYIKVPFIPVEQIKEEKPAFCVDANNNTLFIYIPFSGIKKYDLSSKKVLYDYFMEYRYYKRNHSFQLHIIDDYVVFSSYLRILIFNKKLELQADIRDTIEKNTCPGFALHKFDIEFNKDTLLFKAMFVEISDFKENKRYKRIFKDYEFILGRYKIECKNCDSCEKRILLLEHKLRSY